MPGTKWPGWKATCGLGEEVVRVPIEHEAAHPLDRDLLLGHELGRVQEVEGELVLVGLLDDLQAELPLRIRPRGDGFPQVAEVEVQSLPRS
jgi:hypothetical protein